MMHRIIKHAALSSLNKQLKNVTCQLKLTDKQAPTVHPTQNISNVFKTVGNCRKLLLNGLKVQYQVILHL